MTKAPNTGVKKAKWVFWTFSDEADKDYLLARMICFCGPPFLGKAGLLGQQACEKYMKAVMVQANQTYIETHQLLKLAKACEPIDPYFGQTSTKEILKKFDAFEQVGRYGTNANFDPSATNSGPLMVGGLVHWDDTYLEGLDSFVTKSRGMLDFARENHPDGLKRILNKETKSFLYGSWTGQPSLDQILTRRNSYYF